MGAEEHAAVLSTRDPIPSPTKTLKPTMNPQTACHFANIPLEIRLAIYELYLDYELQCTDVVTYSTTYLASLSTSNFYRASPPPALAQTCKFFNIDLKPIFQNLLAIHVSRAQWGLRIGMGGYGPRSPAESDGLKWHPARLVDGGGLVLTPMTKCYVRVNEDEMESIDCLSDFLAQVTSNAERERCKKDLWDYQTYQRRQEELQDPLEVLRRRAERGRRARLEQRRPWGTNLNPLTGTLWQTPQGGAPTAVPTTTTTTTTTQGPAPQGSAPTAVRNPASGIMRGMGPYAPNQGPSRRNGLGKAAEGIKEFVFEYAPIRGIGIVKTVHPALVEIRAEERKAIEKRFWDLVIGLEQLELVRIQGREIPAWWKEYLEEKMADRVKAGTVRVAVRPWGPRK